MFLVSASIRVAEYMSDYDSFIEENRIVMACDLEEAREKYNSYWEEQSTSYGTSYSVYYSKITETLM
jgi:hypothetical protein